MIAYPRAFRRCFDFSGRSSRAEFWIYVILMTVVGFVIADIAIFLDPSRPVGKVPLLVALFWIIHFLPSFALLARRLHDTGRSTAWISLLIGPLLANIVIGPFATLLLTAGVILMIIFASLPSQPGDNQYGPNPADKREVDRSTTPPVDSADSASNQLLGSEPFASKASKRPPVEELERLQALRVAGVIDETEFASMKAAVLARQ